MVTRLTLTAILILSATCTAAQQPNVAAAKTYGDIQVQKVLRLDPLVQIHCNLKNVPPIIGQNIPVRIKGLKPSKNPQDNLKLLIFLNDFLLSKTNSPKKIVLKNIQRGESFCLIADIEIDGKDLCGMLVQKNFVNKIIEVPSTALPETTEQPAQTQAAPEKSTSESAPESQGTYIASSSSKIFHRDTCYHVQRMDKSKAVTFSTREEAEQSGRRPCKTCKP